MSDTLPVVVDRELSWLKFNERVMGEGARADVPLCERLLFLRIFQTNLDEFFRVRVGTLMDRTGPEIAAQLEAVRADVRRLLTRKEELYRELLAAVRALKVSSVDLVSPEDWTHEERTAVDAWFAESVAPYLTAIALGKRQTFPFLRDREIYLAAWLGRKGAKGSDAKKRRLGVLGCTTAGLARLVALPSGRQALLEDVIRMQAGRAFPGFDVHATTLVRVTRNADLDPDAEYDDHEDYREFMGKLMKARRHRAPVRLEVASATDAALLEDLKQRLGIGNESIVGSGVPLDFAFFETFRDRLRAFPELFYPRHTPHRHAVFSAGSILPQIRKADRLLVFPEDSMQPFLSFLQEAASDPKTVSIRMTLYRVAAQSQIVEALIAAAENGKEVEVVVELKARFDEENNIELSRRLEAAGCQVVYGLEGAVKFVDAAITHYDLKGKVVLLSFCAYAQESSALSVLSLREIYEKYAPQGFEIYQIGMDENEHYWRMAVDNLPWICVHDGNCEWFAAANGTVMFRSPVASTYGVQMLPTYFLINRDNEVVLRIEDEKALADAIASYI